MYARSLANKLEISSKKRGFKGRGGVILYIHLHDLTPEEIAIVEGKRWSKSHTGSGRSIGSQSFIKKMERKLDRIFKLRPRGRLINGMCLQ